MIPPPKTPRQTAGPNPARPEGPVSDGGMKPTPERKIASYRHLPEGPPVQQVDTTRGNYYVSAFDRIDNTGRRRVALVLGPFKNNHAGALAMVGRAGAKAEELDPWAAFYSFGTVRMARTFTRPGAFNRFFEETRNLGSPPRRRK